MQGILQDIFSAPSAVGLDGTVHTEIHNACGYGLRREKRKTIEKMTNRFADITSILNLPLSLRILEGSTIRAQMTEAKF